MSLKSLGIASIGLLKGGLKKMVHIASNGLIRFDKGGKVEEFVGVDGMGPYGGQHFRTKFLQDQNNLVIILTS